MIKNIILWIVLLITSTLFSQTKSIDSTTTSSSTRALPPPDGGGDGDWWWLTKDYDNDGYGAPGNPRIKSSKPQWPGYASNEDDCDDHNPNVHPGATEICGDGIDNNCNGRIDETMPTAPLILSITKNCGSTIITRGSPPSGITWYWQSSSSGTSTSNSSVSITRTSGTIYYLRGYNSSSGCWGPSNPISYSVNTVPGAPSVPTITKNCGSTVLTRGTPPSGITWYWQSSSSGTSTSNSSASVTLSSGSTYYLRARNNSTGCWSSVRSVSYSINTVPGTPSV
ncbi:putative metal-binding motif-containing protein, partial [Joostella atrarenae]